MSKFCIHGDYGQACAQCHYEFHEGKCPCDSCKLIRSGRRIAELEQQRDELLAALEPFADIQHYALAPDGAGFAMRSNGEAVTYGQIRAAKTLIAKVKQ